MTGAPSDDRGPWRYDARLTHARRAPLRHAFAYDQPMWLVDLDAVPELRGPWRALLRFDAGDHLGDPGRSLRANVDEFLLDHGEETPDRVLLLTNPRSLGHAFNPLSVFWCFDRTGSIRSVVAEVHNTYGGRHCYLLHPDAAGRAGASKELYVSPFFPVDGTYEMRFTDPRERLDLAISLHRDGRPVFHATLRGAAPIRVRSTRRSAFRHVATAWIVSARIRIQGIRLWLRGLPVVPRAATPEPALEQRGVAG